MTDFYSVNQVGAFAQLPGDLSARGSNLFLSAGPGTYWADLTDVSKLGFAHIYKLRQKITAVDLQKKKYKF